MKPYISAIFVILSLILSACKDNQPDPRLEKIASLAPSMPDSALVLINAIDRSALSERDRHYYDLLSIKAKDKAYILHTSDSLVLAVIDWYGSHKKTGLYPEALYYGGRVYSDLGDYPTSLKYFQQALDELPEDMKNQKLRATVLSQTGRLLSLLRLYGEAERYVKKSIKMNRLMGDTVNEVNNLQLLGYVLLREGKYYNAERIFQQSLGKSKFLPELLRINSTMYLGAAKLDQGEVDSALMLIRNIPESINDVGKNTAYAYAAKIYLKAGILDTAFYYAYKLIKSNDDYNKQIGYHVLLSPELRNIINTDTISKYVKDYSMLIEKRYDENENQLALNQQAFYNYQLHERKREKAEQSKRLLFRVLIIISISFILLFILVLYMKYRNSIQLLRLNEALNGIQTLRMELEDEKKKSIDTIIKHDAGEVIKNDVYDKHESIDSRNPQELRKRLISELMDLRSTLDCNSKVPTEILRSDVYESLITSIKDKKVIPDDSTLWEEIESVVIEASPDFKKKLTLLLGGKLKPADYQTALLTKFGISITEMSYLVGRSKSAIVYRRNSLGNKLFGQKTDLNIIDDIIRLL